MIEAFVTWADGTTSTVTGPDYGSLFQQIESTPKEFVSAETHLIMEE